MRHDRCRGHCDALSLAARSTIEHDAEGGYSVHLSARTDAMLFVAFLALCLLFFFDTPHENTCEADMERAL